MHKVLQRQLTRIFGSLEAVPKELEPFVSAVEAAYSANDADRALLERSLELTSQELMERNADLQREVAELRRVQEALRWSEERYRLIVATAAEGIWLFDREGRTTFVNQRVADLLGRQAREIVGHTWTDFMDEEGKALAEGTMGEANRGTRDLKFQRPNGQAIWAIVSASPLPGQSGQREGLLCMLTDITARRKAEEDLRVAYAKLEELVRYRTQFLNNTAHELATPLTPLKLQIHVLRHSLGPQVQGEHRRGLEILERNIERLSKLVNDVLDAARLQSGRVQLRRREYDLADIAAECVESFQPLADQQNLTLTFRREAALPVNVDGLRVSQVIFNLLSNAFKFTPVGGRVEVVARAVQGDAEISVLDTGQGIAAESLARLFQPFSQVHDPMKNTVGGTGLGLFVSKGIVEEHGGMLFCDSEGVGRGCRFYFRIPLAAKRGPEPANIQRAVASP